MKILVLSDSHSGLSFMRLCIRAVKPDAIVHLGDHYDDGETMAQEFPHIPMHQVPGNCDRYRMLRPQPEILCYDVCGVRLYMTHGHLHGVKSGLYRLLLEARKADAQGVLFGHTHAALCREEDGLWVLNPGSCGSFGGSCGMIETENNQITACRNLTQADLEEML